MAHANVFRLKKSDNHDRIFSSNITQRLLKKRTKIDQGQI